MKISNKNEGKNISRREFLAVSAAGVVGGAFPSALFGKPASYVGDYFRFAVTSDIHMYKYNLETGATHTEFRDFIRKDVQKSPHKGRENTDLLRRYNETVIPAFIKSLLGAGNLKWGPKVTKNVLLGYENEVNGHLGSEETNYSFDYKNCHFVVIDGYFGNGYKTAQGTYPARGNGNIVEPLYDWLQDDLANTKQKHILVFGHEPAWAYTYSDKADDGYGKPKKIGHRKTSFMEKNAERLWAVFEKNGVTAYFCGHIHAYGAVKHNGVWQVVIGSSMTSCNGWGMVDVSGDKVTYESYRYKLGGTAVKRIMDSDKEYELTLLS